MRINAIMNVLLPQPIETEAISLLEKKNCSVTIAPDPKPETVVPLLKDAHGLILRTGITITRELIEAADKLMVISRTGGGLDNVEVGAATEKGIIVTSNLGVNTISVAGNDFDILCGTVSTLFESMLLGAKGGVVSLANAFPAPCCELYEACKAVDLDKARRLHYMLINLNKSVSGSFGVVGVKYATEVAGYHGGDPRKPLLPITEEGRRSIRKAIEEAGLLKG
jgi:hypothetical protein